MWTLNLLMPKIGKTTTITNFETPITGVFKTQNESIEIISLLIEAGADISDRAANGHSVAHGAAGAGLNEVLQHVHELGADLSLPDVAGRTPRDLADDAGFTDTVALIDALLADSGD